MTAGLIIILCFALFLSHRENSRLREQVAALAQNGASGSEELSAQNISEGTGEALNPQGTQSEVQSSKPIDKSSKNPGQGLSGLRWGKSVPDVTEAGGNRTPQPMR